MYYIFLEAKWRFAWVMSLISTNQTVRVKCKAEAVLNFNSDP